MQLNLLIYVQKMHQANILNTELNKLNMEAFFIAIPTTITAVKIAHFAPYLMKIWIRGYPEQLSGSGSMDPDSLGTG